MEKSASISKSLQETVWPVAVKKSREITGENHLYIKKPTSVSFGHEQMTCFQKQGSFVLLDFGKEMCGGVRLIVPSGKETAQFHIRFGESVTESMAPLGTKNAGNDHSPRDFDAFIPPLSDLTFGQTGFRFVYIELCSAGPVDVQSILAVNRLPYFPYEAKIETNDEKLNQIIETAKYTIKLCCQNGYIWDGIKRDRLVWSGDLHQEILTAFYCFGDIDNIQNAIDLVRHDTKPEKWANWIPSYSAWWIICLCDYINISGNTEFFEENTAYAAQVLHHINTCIAQDGSMTLNDTRMPYFLDWQTFGTEDAKIGTASIFLLAAQKYLLQTKNTDAREIINKLMPMLENAKPQSKQTVAFRSLTGIKSENLVDCLEYQGAHEFSTFMAYYILKADAEASGQNILPMIKEYFGGMLEKGATTFWEDFDLDWLVGTSRIDQFPKKGEKDIHGDCGKFCYENFRHSLCHGWASGVLAFVVEYIFGIRLQNGKIASFSPNLMGLQYISAELPIAGKRCRFYADKKKTEYDFL